MKFSQCLMCIYIMGRTCKFNNNVISDEIYNNETKCANFKSIVDCDIDVDDSCCQENIRYEEVVKRYEKN